MSKNKVSSSIVLKSGLWYTVCNIAFRAVAFLTTPIFTRVLSKAEYGQYNNLSSWISLVLIFATCDMYTSIIRAKLDFEEDLERYSFSVLTTASVITLAFYVVVMLNHQAIAAFMGIDPKYFHVMFLYALFVEAYYVYITFERAHYRYKAFSLLTGLTIVAGCGCALAMVLIMDNKLDGRVYGWYAPYILIGMVMYILVAKRGRSVKLEYCKYALRFSVPLLPHLLAMELLSSSDRIMITKFCGAGYTAIYSIAYSVANIMYILLDSMNKAWAPWLLDALNAKEQEAVRKTTTPYFYLFLAMTVGALFLVPEIILVMGGKSYGDGIYVLPSLLVGVVFQFAYTMYVQVEYFEKKIKMISVATIAAAGVNILLNYLLIPKVGYLAAGYTTLVGYICLFLIHYWTACRLGYRDVFDRRKIFPGLLLAVGLIPVFLWLYTMPLLRFVLLAVYGITLAVLAFRKRNILRVFLRQN